MFGYGRHGSLRKLHPGFLPVALLTLAVLGTAAAAEFAFDSRLGGPFHPAPVINVTRIGWSSQGQVLSTGPGARLASGSQTTLTLVFSNGAWGPIGFTAAATNASGFAVVSHSLPAIAPGETENLTVTLSTPNSPYSGPLWINLS